MKERGIKMSKYNKITREIERVLVDAGIVEVVDESEEGLEKYVD